MPDVFDQLESYLEGKGHWTQRGNGYFYAPYIPKGLDEAATHAKLDALGIKPEMVSEFLSSDAMLDFQFANEIRELQEDMPPDEEDLPQETPTTAYVSEMSFNEVYWSPPADTEHGLLSQNARQIFYIDTGNMPREKVEEYLESIRAEVNLKQAPIEPSKKPVSKQITSVYNLKNEQTPSILPSGLLNLGNSKITL